MAGIGEALPTAMWRTSPVRRVVGEKLLVAESRCG
jgi:hypothetical protein